MAAGKCGDIVTVNRSVVRVLPKTLNSSTESRDRSMQTGRLYSFRNAE